MTVGQARISITIRRSADRLWLITRPYRRLATASPCNGEADLADRLEVSRQTINALETGKYDPSLPLAFRIARLFGQPIETIFQDEAA